MPLVTILQPTRIGSISKVQSYSNGILLRFHKGGGYPHESSAEKRCVCTNTIPREPDFLLRLRAKLAILVGSIVVTSLHWPT